MSDWKLPLRVGLLLGCAIPGTATAQTATAPSPAPSTPPPGDQTAQTSGDVIVTANRREERLQDVPLSVTAISGDSLIEQGVSNPEQLGKLSPSLVTQNNAANAQGTNFSIRGVGTSSFQRSVEPSVAVVVDDVSFVRGELAVINFADIAQIEVLDGPQGFLFGKNASAGLVNIRTNAPVLGETSGRFIGEYGHLDNSAGTDLFKAQAIANLPISADAAARINLYTVQNTALADNAVNNPNFSGGLHQFGGTAKLRWDPGSWSILFAGDYLRSRGNGGGIATLRYTAPTSPLSTVLPAIGVYPSTDNDRSAYDAPTYYNLAVGGAQVRAAYRFDGGLTLTNILAYRRFVANQRFDADYSPLPLVQAFGGRLTMSQISDELRLTSPSAGRLEYQAGLYFLHGRILENDVLSATAGQAVPAGFTTFIGANDVMRQLLDNYAVYGQATYKITDALHFTAGARVTHDDIGMLFVTTNGGGAVGLYPAAGPSSASRGTTNFSWRTTLQYFASRDWMLYGTAAQGYKGPGFAQFSLSYVRPEIPTHFEIGSKLDLFDRRVTFNLAAFNTDFKDFQAQSIDFTTLSYLLLNAGKLRTRGVQLQFSARPTTKLTLGGGLIYTDARFRSFKGDLCYVGQPDCVNGVTDSSGRRLPNAPLWKGSFNAAYLQPVSAGLNVEFAAGVFPTSGYNFLSNGAPNAYQNGYTTVDASVALLNSHGAWSVRAFARNLTDARYVATVQQHPFFTSDYIQNLSYGAFRQLGVTGEFRF